MIFWIRIRASGDDFQPFEIENISGGGILARTESPFERGAHVDLNFELPQHTDLITAEAEVRHNSRDDDGINRVGLQFVRVDNLEVERLIGYLEDLFK